jgi:flavin reductase (DIM6/NTAB) family NADH-FMN oxidoreductase RutF
MACFPSGVVVVTAVDAQGRPRGLTVSAFCPVSLDPPLILVCIDRTSNTLPALRHAQKFTVNILASGRRDLARWMASKSEHKFDRLRWQPSEAGPVLDGDSAAYAICAVEQVVEAGDHWLFVARVEKGAVYPGVTPLVYSRRAFLELG